MIINVLTLITKGRTALINLWSWRGPPVTYDFVGCRESVLCCSQNWLWEKGYRSY